MAKLKVRARAVEMLGRQQVAGIPTAISELFKNAHDAYARKVDVDFYRRSGLFILRDDGLGMTKEDFETRWLTIGTDSKLEGGGLALPPTDPTQPIRPIMGEKGIGRLSIAVIGSQVLVMTRPKLGANRNTITACFIHWGVFSLPGVDLADIDIPIRTFDARALPSQDEVAEMVTAAEANLDSIESKTDHEAVESIRADLRRFKLDPARVAARLPDGPDLRQGGGTQFWILPAQEILAEDIDGGGRSDKAPPLRKVLIGFSNTMTPGHQTPPITARFRDHLLTGLYEERIAEDTFFTPEEFESADHHIKGRFDERGQFAGEVAVYGRSAIPYLIRWPEAGGRATLCGPFSINFAYVQGSPRESRLPEDEYGRLVRKLNQIGGLYIYRDGIRILPYGDSDYDFLDIEGRRTRGAGYYFFSYRRMFGVIEINRQSNHSLLEKAGREGFQENRAYRQFKSILENFFVQTAADFFRPGGTEADVFVAEQERIKTEKELLERRRRQVAVRRRELASAIDKFFADINERRSEREVASLMAAAEERLAAATAETLPLAELTNYDQEVRAQLRELDDKVRIVRPRGVGLPRDLSRAWARYEVERQRLTDDVFRPALDRVDQLVAETAERLNLQLDARKRITGILEDLAMRERRRTRALQGEVRKNLEELRERALDVTRSSLANVEGAVRSTLIALEHSDAETMSEDDLRSTRESLERSIERVAEEQTTLLTRLRDQLKAAATLEALDRDDLVQALEGELEERREREVESMQLAQMGMAIGIVHHEFHAVIRSVRENIRRLQTWADRNPSLADLYRDIRESYAHLDGYLSLFAPLNRRLARSKMKVRGEDIRDYVVQLLGERMQRHGVELDASGAFLSSEVIEYVSTLYPVFINLLDNAIYWLDHGDLVRHAAGGAETKERAKRIELDFLDGAYVVRDTGPGVLPVDYDAIFEPGFSRKPDGSGLGLFITRSVLERSGYRLRLDPYEPGHGATFRVGIPEDALPSETQA